MKSVILHARMLGLALLLTMGMILMFVSLMLLMAQWTGQYHCDAQGGQLIGNSCEIISYES